MIDSDVTQEGAVVTIGDRLVIDYGQHNTEMAYRLRQDLIGIGTLRILLDGKPL